MKSFRYLATRRLLVAAAVTTTVFAALPLPAQQGGPTVLVSRAEESAWIEEISLTGSVVAPRIAELSTEVRGLVAEIRVDIGDRIEAGDQVLRLNDEIESLSLAAARAATEQASHELDDARRRLAEARRLGPNQSATVTQSLMAEVRIDTAELQRYQAEQERQSARVSRHRLTAPFAGLVSRKLVERGEWIEPGQSVIELVALDNLLIDFQVPQSVYARLDDGARLEVQLDALPGRRLAARIESVVPVADPVSRTFLLRAALTESGLKLAPGMSASAVLRLASDRQGVVVPRDAILRYPDGRVTVWIVEAVDDGFRVRERPVTTGSGFDGRVAITSGLESGMSVVVRGNEALYDQQSVQVRTVESSP